MMLGRLVALLGGLLLFAIVLLVYCGALVALTLLETLCSVLLETAL